MHPCPACRSQCFPSDAKCEDCGCPLKDVAARDVFITAAMFTVYRVLADGTLELVEGRAHESEARGIAYHQRTMARANPANVASVIVRKRGVAHPILTVLISD